VGIKAAPGLPRELVPAGWEAEFVAVGRDLKEALLWSPALATARRRATILPAGDTLTSAADAVGAEVPVAAPGAFLLDPSPAVTRAGLVEELARELGAWKIGPRSRSCPTTGSTAPRSRARCGSWIRPRGTSGISPAGWPTSASGPPTSGAAGWPGTCRRSTAAWACAARAAPRSSLPGPAAAPGA
jgi:hypothetical protein